MTDKPTQSKTAPAAVLTPCRLLSIEVDNQNTYVAKVVMPPPDGKNGEAIHKALAEGCLLILVRPNEQPPKAKSEPSEGEGEPDGTW